MQICRRFVTPWADDAWGKLRDVTKRVVARRMRSAARVVTDRVKRLAVSWGVTKELRSLARIAAGRGRPSQAAMSSRSSSTRAILMSSAIGTRTEISTLSPTRRRSSIVEQGVRQHDGGLNHQATGLEA